MPASIFSNAESLGGMARRLLSQPKLEVVLDDHSQGKIYTTLDAISGKFERSLGFVFPCGLYYPDDKRLSIIN